MPLNLPVPPRGVSLVNSDGTITRQFQQWLQSFAKAIEAQFGAVDAAIAAQAAADNANAAAAAAQSAADGANTAATDAATAAAGAMTATDAVTREQNLVNSYVDGTPPILTASDAGANVTIAVASHTRVYGDASTLAITGASVTALSYSTLYYVYYVDATRADTTPTFLATTSTATAAQTGDTHLVGSVTTPAAAAPPATGDSVAPPGIGDLR